MTTVSENLKIIQNGSQTAKAEPIIDGSENLGVIVRRKTRPVQVGNITIGGGAPVVVQSMINEDTLDIDGSVAGIRRLHEIGCEIMRVTKHIHKVRINPGLYVFEKPKANRTEYTQSEFDEIAEKVRDTLKPLVLSLKEQGKAMRIGVNHGSLAERMLFTYGDTPQGMVESAIEFIRICEDLDFRNIVISMKASRVPVMIAAYQLMVKRMDQLGMDYPLHLGVTEAGDGEYGRIKSTAGIATLLAQGIGDTIRVSLTEAPEKEIPVCYSILQSLGLRKTMVEYVACPSCGRTLFNLEEVLHKVREATSHLVGLDIAVMGCIVNGPGEMADADYGYVGKTPGTISLYRGKEEIKRVPEAEGVEQLIALIKSDDRWVDP